MADEPVTWSAPDPVSTPISEVGLKPASGSKLILCIGLFSSGSTWAFNVASRLCRLLHLDTTVLQLYADSIDDDLELKGREADRLVLKSHLPSASLRAMAYLSGVPVIFTVRDPRDAVASLMSRFEVTFEQACSMVEGSCLRLAGCTLQQNILFLRYEDGFLELPATIKTIARCLGIYASDEQCQEVFDALTPSAVEATIKGLEDNGLFDGLAPLTAFDPTSHWHPRHVGDRRVGKWAEALTAVQSAHVAYATRSYCAAFGYDTITLAEFGVDLKFGQGEAGIGCLGRGFSYIEYFGVWIDSPTAVLTLKFVDAIKVGLRIEIEFLVGPAMESALPDARFQIFANDTELIDLRSSRSSSATLIFVTHLDRDLVAGRSTMDLRFESRGMLSVAELGVGDDTRKISLGLKRILVTEGRR